jgi:hypothetical protein
VRLLSIELEDFQAHQNRLIEFSPTITTIRGRTDAGKSAILRALRWVCQNNMAGDDFVREGTKRATVSLRVAHDKKVSEIVRSKNLGGASNTYSLDGEDYKAFGQGIPSDIAALLSLNDINFQSQHDSPFWFAETAGEVSRRLNAVIDLSVIDTTLFNVAAEVRLCQDRKALCEERLTEAQKQLEEMSPQKERVEEFQFVKESNDDFEKARWDKDRLAEVVESIGANKAERLARKAGEVDDLFLLAKEAIRLVREEGALVTLVDSISAQMRKAQQPPPFAPVVTAWNASYDQWKAVDDLEGLLYRIEQCHVDYPPAFEEVSRVRDTKVKAEEDFTDLDELIQLINGANIRVIAKSGMVKTLERRFHDQIKNTICPLCQQAIQ